MKIKKIYFLIVIGVILVLFYVHNIYKLLFQESNNVSNIVDYEEEREYIRRKLISKEDKIIIIDPGHGGKDPGKVGINNTLEKDINLSIAKKLKDKLVKNGFSVIMTRTTDVGLYSEIDSNKKNADLRNRVNIINESDAILVISIHQNAYMSEKEKGAQVFYYNKSNMAREAAICVQNAFKEYHDKYNQRKEKTNTSYYILKNTNKPAIIVECGFLSNHNEGRKLTLDSYQDSIVKAINNGIIIWANKILNDVY